MNSSKVNQVIAAAGHNSGAELDLTDFRNAYVLKQSVTAGAVWVMSASMWAQLQLTKQNDQFVINFTNNNNLLSSGIPAAGITPVGMLWDRPVFLSDQMPAVSDIGADEPAAILGNFKYFYLGERRKVTMSMSKDASFEQDGEIVSAFETEQTLIKVTERVAMAVGVGEAFAVLYTAEA